MFKIFDSSKDIGNNIERIDANFNEDIQRENGVRFFETMHATLGPRTNLQISPHQLAPAAIQCMPEAKTASLGYNETHFLAKTNNLMFIRLPIIHFLCMNLTNPFDKQQ
jgi:hypothetical protein